MARSQPEGKVRIFLPILAKLCSKNQQKLQEDGRLCSGSCILRNLFLVRYNDTPEVTFGRFCSVQ